MQILAIDYGTKNIGLARAGGGVDVALPFGTVPAADAVAQIAQLIRKENIDKLLVGLPLGLDGSENENTRRIRKFAAELEKESGLAAEFINEMFSSQAGDRLAGGASRDEKAAMLILQTYLEQLKNK